MSAGYVFTCGQCGRPMRGVRERAADRPGTVRMVNATTCDSCWGALRATGRPARPLKRVVTPEPWRGLLDDWLADMRIAGSPATTTGLRVKTMRKFAATIAPVRPDQVTRGHLVDFMTETPLGAETRRCRRQTLRAFYAWIADNGRGANLADRLPRVKPGPAMPRPVGETGYRDALMAATPRERLMLRLAGDMGLRRGEISRVHTRDVLERFGGHWLLVHGKGARERLVPIPDAIMTMVRELEPGWLFPGRIDGHLSPHTVGRLLEQLLPAGFGAHTLRHRFGSLAYALERDLVAVQELLGHSSPDITRRYVDSPAGDRRRLVNRVANAT